MQNPHALTCILKQLAYELGSVIGPDDGHRFSWLDPALNGSPQCLDGVLSLTYGAAILLNNNSIEYIDDAENKKEALLPHGIAVLDVHLPKLVASRHRAVPWESAWMLRDPLSCLLKNSELLAKAVHLLRVDDHLVPISNAPGEKFIAIHMLFPFEEIVQPLDDLIVLNSFSCHRHGVARSRASSRIRNGFPRADLFQTFLTVIVRRFSYPQHAQNLGCRFSPLNKWLCYLKSFR